GDGFGQVGEKVTYTLTVTNTGDRTLEGLRIDDPMLPSLACTPALERPLAPGAKLVCTGSHVITEAEAVTGELVNTAVLYSPLLPQTDASATVRTKEAQPVAPTPTSKPAPRPVKHTLPNTGADVSPWMLGLGLLMSMAGIMLIVRRKKENS
ncbi:MAG TPA: LPXTG cell wall anchor domain-containing protein, partial [Candidatus Luteococcus avicola]|nr:LPXTG cell wall anchor domain-containing protein [Candidatus Luteococcus avicola]